MDAPIWLKSLTRRLVPMLVGIIITWLTAADVVIPETFSTELHNALSVVLDVLVGALWAIVVSYVSKYLPWVEWLNGWGAVPVGYESAATRAKRLRS